MNLDTIIKRNPDIISADMKGETVMMSISTGKYHSINAIGASIWELISKPLKVSDLIDSLLEEYEVDRATCEAQVLDFLKDALEVEVVLIVE